MNDKAKSLLGAFDHGRLSRRQLLTALAIAMAARPAFAQGVCGGAKAGTPECDPTPAKFPFEPTGWKTTRLDHMSCQVVDYSKEAAFYVALLNWKIVSDDGTQAVLAMGDRGNMVIRGGYQMPPPPAAGATAAAPRQGDYDGFCWGIEPWNVRKVEAELRKRGLDPVADNSKGFESFHVKDPDGFNLQITDGRRKKSRPAIHKPSAPAPFEPTNWKTVWLDHISFEVLDYKKTVAFYAALMGWNPGTDEGSQNQCEIGNIGDITVRRKRGTPGAPPEPGVTISHLSFGISPFDPDQVKAELLKRGLMAREDTGGKGDIHLPTALYKSFHTQTPNGFNLQISAATKATRILSSLD